MVSRSELDDRYSRYLNLIRNANAVSLGGDDPAMFTKQAVQQDNVYVEDVSIEFSNTQELLIESGSGTAGIQYQSPDLLAYLAVKLTNILQVQICDDHKAYWWFTHSFAKKASEEYGWFPEELVYNLGIVIHLTTLGTPPSDSHEEAVDAIMRSSKILATYLAYPTLEGFAKVACRRDIEMDGTIREGRRIRKLTQPDRRVFMTKDNDQEISNFAMLLWHLETEVAGQRNRELLANMREEVAEMLDLSPDYILGRLYGHRNDSLHGHHTASREYGVLLNYICLIIWIILYPDP